MNQIHNQVISLLVIFALRMYLQWQEVLDNQNGTVFMLVYIAFMIYQSTRKNFFLNIILIPIEKLRSLFPVCCLGIILMKCRLATIFMSRQMKVYGTCDKYFENKDEVQSQIFSVLGVINFEKDSCLPTNDIWKSFFCVIILQSEIHQASTLQSQHHANIFFWATARMNPVSQVKILQHWSSIIVIFDLFLNFKTTIQTIALGFLYMTLTFMMTLWLRVCHYSLFDALVHPETALFFIIGAVAWSLFLPLFKRSFDNTEQSEDAQENKGELHAGCMALLSPSHQK